MASYRSVLNRVFGGDSGSLDVVLDQKDEVFRAGGRLNGKVLIAVHKETTGGKVEVELIGRERSTRKKGPVDLCKDHVFFSFSLPVRDLTKSPLNPGPITLPFSIDLPTCLPSSSIYKVGVGDVGFSIQYKLTARMGNSSKSIPVGVAAAALQGPKAPFLMQPTPQPVFSMKGSNLGSIVTSASVQNTSARKGDKIIVSLSCRNDSPISIQRVEVRVLELLNWGLKEGYSKRKTNKRTLVSIADIDLPGLQREHDNESCLVDANYPTMEDQNAKYSTMHNDLVSGDNSFEVELPFYSRDTYTGGILVDIRHYLKIKFITDGNSFAAQPSIKIPLTIGLPDEIPRASITLDAEIPSKSMLNMDEKEMSGCTSTDLPLASAVPLPIQNDFDQIEKKAEPLPQTRKKLGFRSGVEVQESKDVETSLRNLVPIAPSP